MFVLQAGVVKGRGGITTATLHYARMLQAVGAPSAAAFRGPALTALSSEGIDVLEVPGLLKTPLARVPLLLRAFQHAVLRRAGGRSMMVIVHSDLLLSALRCLFPRAFLVTPCHSDKFKRKLSSDLIVTLNPNQHELVRRGLPKAQVALLGNPYVAKPKALSSPPGPPRINFIGRLVPDKDPLCLLRAAQLLQESAGLEFRFIGAGPLEAELREASASGGPRLTFAGWQNAPFSFFHENDILVSSSVWEALPYLLHEALDHGVPIIASDIPGNRAALDGGRFGLLFEKGNADALANAIRMGLSDLQGLRCKARMGGSAVRARYGAHPFWCRLTAALADVQRHRTLRPVSIAAA
jgi:glycosyltransferase involved in cell wall biosynthesis